jgi:hypothetical protein
MSFNSFAPDFTSPDVSSLPNAPPNENIIISQIDTKSISSNAPDRVPAVF